jgi:protein SPT2
MSTYAALIAQSRKQTAVHEQEVKATLEAQKKKEALERKAQEEREKRDKQYEAMRVKQLLEQQRRDAEREKRKEDEQASIEKALKRREQEMREKLLGGSKSRASGSSGGGGSGGSEGSRKRKGSEDRDNHDSPRAKRSRSPAPSQQLTREELKEKKRLATLREWEKDDGPRRPAKKAGSGRKSGTLRGGAVPIITTTPVIQLEPSPSGKSARERLAAMPLTLTKLNTVKRDMRTIEEILADRDRARTGKVVLEGDAAKSFNWFQEPKKKNGLAAPTENGKGRSPSAGPSSNVPSRTATPSQTPPPPGRSSPAPPRHSSQPSDSRGKAPLKPKPRPVITSTTVATSNSTSGTAFFHKGSSSQPTSSQSTARNSHATSHSYSQPKPHKPRVESKLKRSRSLTPSDDGDEEVDSDDLDRLPSKRKSVGGSATGRKSYLPDDVFEMITGGRSRNHFSASSSSFQSRSAGLFDDDEEDYDSGSDMEVGIDELTREEMRSAKIAKKEDKEEAERLRRHELEKERRRREKERRRGDDSD